MDVIKNYGNCEEQISYDEFFKINPQMEFLLTNISKYSKSEIQNGELHLAILSPF